MQRVVIVESGREGRVEYAEASGTIGGYWEFGGDDIVTIVNMGSREDWQRSHTWGLEKRASILRFIADEVIRQRAPSCSAEIDEQSGSVVLRQKPGAASHAPTNASQAKAAAFVAKLRDLKSMLAIGVLAVALIAGALVWLGQKALTVAPGSGSPLNESVRFDGNPGGIATLIRTTDSRFRDISGRGGNDTTSLSILITPLDGAEPRLIPVVGNLSSHGYDLARIMGSDGRTVWFDAMGFYGVRLDGLTLVTPKDLRTANPDLDLSWWDDPRGIDIVDGKLNVMRIDRSAAVIVDPDTWKATPTGPKPTNARFERREPADHLAAGVRIAPDTWLGLHSQAERAGDFKPGKWIKPVESANAEREKRSLTKAVLEASSDGNRYRIRTIVPLGDAEYLEAAFLRMNAKSEPLRVSEPASTLMIHTSGQGGASTLVVSRVDDQGNLLWSTDTGLDRFSLKQILPGQDVLAFIGTRPPIPDKLSQPLIVLVESKTGKLTSHSLSR
ncbi:MAG: hypothetical protein HOP13_09445 [Alphaproteobacteria bacterium]|nr:hypothetical protein [Alphaproteobacteria bacterium]